ncbi:MAG TPA: hypothetical protein PLW93_00765 [Candidatus Absconditabacterales bacterium]|nr:hypothetical protein [Candidatus Absconditabacterales bacterium]HNG96782.1 hypothetical protein [Candidatus Absconditabacterales bacterium]
MKSSSHINLQTQSSQSSQTSVILNNKTVDHLLSVAKKSNSTKKEVASALTIDNNNSSTTVVQVHGQSTSGSVSYTHRDLHNALQTDSYTTTQGIQFHTHIQSLNHANVHSNQDETQHTKNIAQSRTGYGSQIRNCLGNGIIGVRKDGGFSIKARGSDDNLIQWSYGGTLAEELIFDQKGKLKGFNTDSTLDPQDNTPDSRDYQSK